MGMKVLPKVLLIATAVGAAGYFGNQYLEKHPSVLKPAAQEVQAPAQPQAQQYEQPQAAQQAQAPVQAPVNQPASSGLDKLLEAGKK